MACAILKSTYVLMFSNKDEHFTIHGNEYSIKFNIYWITCFIHKILLCTKRDTNMNKALFLSLGS